MTESPTEQDALRRDGFAHLPAILGRDAPSLAQEAARAIQGMAVDLGIAPDRYLGLISAWGGRNPMVASLTSRCVPMLAGAVRIVAARELSPVGSTLFVKSVASPAETHAHQDIAYRWNRPVEEYYEITTWVSIDAADQTTGALSFLPGSHDAPISPRQDFLDREFQDRAASPDWAASAVTVSTDPGDVVVFDHRVWHAAGPFTGHGMRRALAIRWSSGQPSDVPAPHPSPERFGMDTSGAHLIAAIRDVRPGFEPDRSRGAVGQACTWLLSQRSVVAVLPAGARSALEDLHLALKARERHEARPNARLWLSVRDQLIPALREARRPAYRRSP